MISISSLSRLGPSPSRRGLSSFSRNYLSVDYLLSAIPKTPVPEPKKKPAPQGLPPSDLTLLVYTPDDLNLYFHHAEYPSPSKSQISETESFFNRSLFRHEWTCATYADIPDVKVKRKQQEQKNTLDTIEPYNRTQYHANLENSRKTFGVKPDLLRPLPEILLLGHTNAGKSTLINSLFLDKNQAKTPRAETEYAYVSPKAGYTKCLNCYTVGNKLRVVDSPGYGEFGEGAQGEVVLDYIRNRAVLRRTFVVVDSTKGIRDEDASLIGFLTENGAPFEIVFTKVDSVFQAKFPKVSLKHAKRDADARVQAFEHVKTGNSNVISHFRGIIESAGLQDLATLPRLLFNNSRGNRLLPKRYGFKEIRYAIMESCGLVASPVVDVDEEQFSAVANKGRRKRATRRVRPT